MQHPSKPAGADRESSKDTCVETTLPKTTHRRSIAIIAPRCSHLGGFFAEILGKVTTGMAGSDA